MQILTGSWAAAALGCSLGLKGCRDSAPHGVQHLGLTALELKAIGGIQEKV